MGIISLYDRIFTLALVFCLVVAPLPVESQPTLFVTDGGNLFSVDTLPFGVSTLTLPSEALSPGGMAISPKRASLYFSGSSFEILQTSFGADTATTIVSTPGFPHAIDYYEGDESTTTDDALIYYEGSPSNHVVSLNLDTMTPTTIITDEIQDIVVDPEMDKLFLADFNDGEIAMTDIDGSNRVTVVAPGFSALVSTVAVQPGQFVFWGEQGNDRVMKADIDGTNQVEIMTGVEPRDISVDFNNDLIFVSDNVAGQVLQANFDGSDFKTILTGTDGLSMPGDLAFLPPPILNPNTVIEDPPVAEVEGRNLTLTLQPFEGVTTEAGSQQGNLAAARSRETFRYDVRVTPTTGGARARKLLTKRNEVTIRKLKPATYEARYRAIIYRKKNRKQRQRAKERGVKGIRRKLRKVAATDFSPSVTAEIGGE